LVAGRAARSVRGVRRAPDHRQARAAYVPIAGSPTPDQADKEWQVDGRAWHLEQQLAPDGRAIVEALIELIGAGVPQADGPYWSQKNYIAWRAGSRNWLGCYTDAPHQAGVFVRGLASIPPDTLAERLGWATFDAAAELSAKLALGSYVGFDRKGRMRLVIKSVDDIKAAHQPLGDVLRSAWEAFSSGKAATPA
jgi:hypothetical protein